MFDDSEPHLVYTNALIMLKSRGFTVTSQVDDNTAVTKKLVQPGYVTISGTREASDVRGAAKTTVVVIAPESKYAAKTPDFRKLIQSVKSSSAPVSSDLSKGTYDARFEILVFTDQAISPQMKKMVVTEISSTISIECYDYGMCSTNKQEHDFYATHQILSNQEATKLLESIYSKKSSIPTINDYDTQAVWLGLRKGMVVMIHRVSESAGGSITYRLCK